MKQTINNVQAQKEIKRGDIYIANLPNSNGSIQQFKRPVVIISNNACNQYSNVLHICPLTSVTTKSKLPTHIPISRNSGLKMDSIALCEQSMPVTRDLIEEKIGQCDEETMLRIDRGIGIQFGLVELRNKNGVVYA